ncbi:hypothetical protein EU546_05420 [Candidatus Thorarchaeota archaeon]|nr:MAG: hypothetical protein EU546_05420 [Candidatus Thorarchaeota archaeon]
MTTKGDLARRVLEMAEAIREKGEDPFAFRLTEEFQELRASAAEIDSRIDIDEMLNEILTLKVTRVQELAKILAAPEVYVNALETVKPLELAKMIEYNHPITTNTLSYGPLSRAFERVLHMIEALSAEPPEDPVPQLTGIPDDFMFESEDSVFIKDLDEFLKEIPKGREVLIDEIIQHKDFEEFLRRFLLVVVLIARGRISYNADKRTIRRD